MSDFTHHAKLVWCPNNCTFQQGRTPTKLKVKKYKDNIWIQKSCSYCDFKIKYPRTDTSEGRKYRADQHYQMKIRPNLPIASIDPTTKKPALTAAERMRNMRARRRELESIEGGEVVTDD